MRKELHFQSMKYFHDDVRRAHLLFKASQISAAAVAWRGGGLKTLKEDAVAACKSSTTIQKYKSGF